MTHPDLQDLMRRASDDLAAPETERLVAHAVRAGTRRRTRRRALEVLSVTAVVGLVAGGALLLTGGDNPQTLAPTTSATRSATDPVTSPDPQDLVDKALATYDPGSATRVPEGPSIDTTRRLASDTALEQTLRRLLDGRAQNLTLTHVLGSGVGGHLAETSTDGRSLSFAVDGAAAQVMLGRWDGYAAVGVDERGDPMAVVHPKSACEAPHQGTPQECVESPAGWYTVGHPNAGGEPGGQELWVDLYTADGWVVRVHSLNTAGEKVGGPVTEGTALDEAESLALASSPNWFVSS